MKQIIVIILLVLLSFTVSCHKQEKTLTESVVTSEETLPIDDKLNVQSSNGTTVEVYDTYPSSEYKGLDFSSLPVTKRMLDRWNSAEPEMMNDFQYRNSGLTLDEIDIIANAYISKYGISEEEKKIVGYWFALDGADKNNEDMSFMDALRRSRYPRLDIYPNGYFMCGWANNGPLEVFEKVDRGPVEGFVNILFRGRWDVRAGKVFLSYYQYYIYIENKEPYYINLQTPYELELVSLDAISPDNICTEPFAAFTQPAEIMEQIPDELIFINKPEYFIRSHYTYSVNIDNGQMEPWSPLYSTADLFLWLKENEDITIDDILTSTEGRLQKDYWH